MGCLTRIPRETGNHQVKKLLSAAVVAVAATLAAAPAANAAPLIKLVAGPFATKAKCDSVRASSYRGPDFKCQRFNATPDGEIRKGWYVREY